MKKEVLIILGFVMIISAGVLAQTLNEGISKDVEDYVKGFVNNTGVNEKDIKNVNKINQSNLPDDIDIKKIDDNKVGIYEVNYTKDNILKKIYVITYATDEFKKVQTYIKNIQSLSFGYSGISNSSSYLESSSRVKLNDNLGYVMLRPGSVTGISTSIEIPEGQGEVYIMVYKNGKDTGFRNLISSGDNKKVDFDIQSEDALNYQAGDIISVYVYQAGEIKWGNVVTIVEVTS